MPASPVYLFALFGLFTSVLSAADAFDIRVADQEHVAVSHDGETVAKFMIANDRGTPERHHDTYKPYLHVFSADGETRLTKGPGFQYTHHRGIFLGFSKIGFEGKSYDRWHMKGGDQVVTKILPTDSGFLAHIDWQGDTREAILTEQRQFEFSEPAAPFYLAIEMVSEIKTVRGEAELNGDPEHAGAQFRPSEKVDTTSTTYILPGENTNAHKAKDLPWVAEIFTVEGKTFTVLMLNHPENPQDTAFSAYRDYGRFGAFPKGKATADSPFELRYQWLIAESDVRDVAAYQQAWNTFADQDQPVPAFTVNQAE